MTKAQKTITSLVPAIFSLAVANAGMSIMSGMMVKMFAEEIKQRSMEFKLMGVIEIEKNDKSKKVIEYRKLRGINKYIKNFLKRNPKWKAEKENSFGLETGRIILTRVYRKYNKDRDWKDEDTCPECGRSYND